MTESDDGKSMGVGGDSRVHFAMIQIFNSIHQALFADAPLVSPAEVRSVITSVDRGIKTVWLLGSTKRMAYFGQLKERLTAAIRNKRPVIKLINLSVFGFSRGAAESRAFANWLLECCENVNGAYLICGIPIRFQFLGIFDTVASVGLADSSPVGDGFFDWADGTMKIPAYVERCVHFVAAHEIRQSFPLSTGRHGNAYPSNCTEVVYPGAHCDVGGGYSPGDQGKSVVGRSHLASQVPLLNMYFEARKTGVPMLTMQEFEMLGDRESIKNFQISDELALRFQCYSKWSRIAVKSVEDVLFENMRLYWRWRVQAGVAFKELRSFKASNEQDKEDLMASEKDFLTALESIKRARRQQGWILGACLAAEAEMNKRLHVPVDVFDFFDEYIHDSHASFRLLGPITADDRRVAIAKIKAKKSAGKALNKLEVRALIADAASPGSFPVMRDSDIYDLYEMAGVVSSTAVKAITDTRRETWGHIRNRKVFDKS